MLELDRLTRRFGDLVALDGLSFSVEPGEMFGFVGSNGAGKTTAMRIIMGVDAPDEGEVRFGGRPIDADMRARFGYVPEERGLYSKTPALRQLTYLGRLHRLDKAGVEDIDTAADALRALGVEPVDVQRVDGVIAFCEFQDPFGNQLWLYQEL